MRVGLIVDGQGELDYFAQLLPKITTPMTVIPNALYAGMQPRATPNQMARSAAGAVKILCGRGVDVIVILIDSEGQECPGNLAIQIQSAFQDVYGHHPRFEVVVKHRCLENWLLADVDAIRSLRARFKADEGLSKVVGRADNEENARGMLEAMAQKDSYHKKKDPKKIGAQQDPLRMAKNSRSFRRLLRVLQSPHYSTQSRLPIVERPRANARNFQANANA